MRKADVFAILSLILAVSGVIYYLYLHRIEELERSYFKMQYEKLEITAITFQPGNATIYIKNTGSKYSRILSVRVDDEAKAILAIGGNILGSGAYELDCEASGTITVDLSWTSGNRYTFMVETAVGNRYVCSATAPLGFSLSDQPIWKEWWFWTVIGAVTVILAAGAAFLIIGNRSIAHATEENDQNSQSIEIPRLD